MYNESNNKISGNNNINDKNNSTSNKITVAKILEASTKINTKNDENIQGLKKQISIIGIMLKTVIIVVVIVFSTIMILITIIIKTEIVVTAIVITITMIMLSNPSTISCNNNKSNRKNYDNSNINHNP